MRSGIIRPMAWWDIPDVVVIENELFPVDPWSAEQFWAELAGIGDSRHVVVMTVSERIVGYCSLRTVGSEGDINTIAVAKNYQGQGYGHQLFDWMHDRALQHKVTQLFLEVRSDNEVAHSMYVSLGFEGIDKRKDYYGSGVDALVMRKRLQNV